MEKYSILLGYFDKQLKLINRLYDDVRKIELGVYEKRYVFALKTQQLYTAVEDLLKQIAKGFENHIQDLAGYHKELLIRLNTEVPLIRPAVISQETFVLLDKIRGFRHFIRHAYDCELNEVELQFIQDKLNNEFYCLIEDLRRFREYIIKLASE